MKFRISNWVERPARLIWESVHLEFVRNLGAPGSTHRHHELDGLAHLGLAVGQPRRNFLRRTGKAAERGPELRMHVS